MTSVWTRTRLLLLLGALCVAAYVPSLPNRFVWDDDLLVTNNSSIRNSSFLPSIFLSDLFHNYNTPVATHYRPLQTVTFLVDYHFWGHSPFGYHLTNLLLHLGCVLLLALLIERWSRNRFIAFGVAALFAVHPVNANAIAYVAGRADPLAFGFVLLALLAWQRYRETAPDRSVQRIGLYALAVLSLVAGLFSRENAMLFPLLVLIVGVCLEAKSNFRAALFNALPFLLIVVAFYFWHDAVLHLSGKPIHLEEDAAATGNRLTTALRALAVYGGLLIWPARLQMMRDVGNSLGLTLAGAGFVMILGGWLVWARRRVPLAFFGLVWFLATLAPQLGLLSLNATVAEHWLYVPAVGFYLALVATLAQVWPTSPARQRLFTGAVVLALVALTTRTVFRCQDWATPITLFTQTEQAAPQSAAVRANLGLELSAAGRTNLAAVEFQSAEKLNPAQAAIRVKFARFHLQQGRLPEARRKASEALAIEPGNVAAHLLLAEVCDEQGDVTAANREFTRACVLTPDVSLLVRHGAFWLKHRRFSQAHALTVQARECEPGNPEISNLEGAILTEEGRFDEARASFQRAAQQDRHSPDPYTNLGKLAVHQNDYSTAESCYRTALALSDDDPALRYQLGVLLWHAGKFDAAHEELALVHDQWPEESSVQRSLERVEHHLPYSTATDHARDLPSKNLSKD